MSSLYPFLILDYNILSSLCYAQGLDCDSFQGFWFSSWFRLVLWRSYSRCSTNFAFKWSVEAHSVVISSSLDNTSFTILVNKKGWGNQWSEINLYALLLFPSLSFYWTKSLIKFLWSLRRNLPAWICYVYKVWCNMIWFFASHISPKCMRIIRSFTLSINQNDVLKACFS